MKRLWIRAHALDHVKRLAERNGIEMTIRLADIPHVYTAAQMYPNSMIVMEIDDDLAAAVMRDGYLITCGKVLADGEEPPYVGSDPKLTEEEGA